MIHPALTGLIDRYQPRSSGKTIADTHFFV
jgi:hypothetical protein